jgi:hypothetical protein
VYGELMMQQNEIESDSLKEMQNIYQGNRQKKFKAFVSTYMPVLDSLYIGF